MRKRPRPPGKIRLPLFFVMSIIGGTRPQDMIGVRDTVSLLAPPSLWEP